MPWSSPLGSRRCPPTRTKAGCMTAVSLSISSLASFFFSKKKSNLVSPVILIEKKQAENDKKRKHPPTWPHSWPHFLLQILLYACNAVLKQENVCCCRTMGTRAFAGCSPGRERPQHAARIGDGIVERRSIWRASKVALKKKSILCRISEGIFPCCCAAARSGARDK